MARKKKAAEGSNIPEWLVTFADLMSILVAFFVLIISFSVQDQQKLQVVAGSMRDAFGVQQESRKSGMIEIEGIPLRTFVKDVSQVETENDTEFAAERNNQRRKQGPEAVTHDYQVAEIQRSLRFSAAAASLRQAWEALPEINEMSEQILVEETPEGLNIQLVDQDGRSMFAPGSIEPYEYTRQILMKMAPVLKALPNRIQITGYTDSTRMYEQPGSSQWQLTADRANAARRVLSEGGIPHDRFFSVVGKADSEPLFPDNPFLAANRRISILVMAEAPPVPPSLQP
jgi:chemotaxis protein MotB